MSTPQERITHGEAYVYAAQQEALNFQGGGTCSKTSWDFDPRAESPGPSPRGLVAHFPVTHSKPSSRRHYCPCLQPSVLRLSSDPGVEWSSVPLLRIPGYGQWMGSPRHSKTLGGEPERNQGPLGQASTHLHTPLRLSGPGRDSQAAALSPLLRTLSPVPQTLRSWQQLSGTSLESTASNLEPDKNQAPHYNYGSNVEHMLHPIAF